MVSDSLGNLVAAGAHRQIREGDDGDRGGALG